MRYLLSLSGLTGLALAQNGAWQQCGGQNWSGSTTCISGYTCSFINDYYSQCVPGSNPNPPSTTLSTVTQPSSSPTNNPNPGTGKFVWVGTNEAGGEFGENNLPGTLGKDYTFPDTAAIDTLIGQGYNTFRVQLKMERLTSTLTGSHNQAYLDGYSKVINHITQKGAYAVLDPHNYGRFFGNVITDTSAFQTWWKNLAAVFKNNDRVIFDTNNEYHSMDQTLVLKLNQAAIDGIRSTGAKQYIFVEGNQWSGAWSWPDVNDNMKALTDPEGKIVYQMHQYLDSDSSGTSEACVSSTIGAERVKAATAWLKKNGKVGILGEFAGGANSQCKAAVQGMLDYLEDNSDVWKGVLWWAAGPWWGTYMYSFEPPSGTGYQYYNSLLKTYV
ncbi:CBM1 domain-containing protein [Fusarium keratoplasticum]|uniref:CBM1 domain-containing protein n=1 Tax=Fusarium keratoplasticum TaxID=1328300 RepID=A0ACC0QDQ9_9HYPO|nr:CBM1 domain-containing protein [Fusarium keratoplasticum]KAI8650487.1 CBM1 domain-containing protein [Fusarium keratoplasticum]KAI8651308.1 CBM1 domain-containing protein [Fusarium keratoplasticum]